MRVRIASILLLIAAAAPAQTPESLQTILDRGHVRQWFVAGPFEPDVSGGIATAIRNTSPRLGETDYLEPIGGVRRARPRDQLAMTTPTGASITWQLANRSSPALNLAPLLGDRDEAVVFAAFYAVADRPQTVLLEIDSALGARVAHNGLIVHDIDNVPPADLNTQWLVLDLRGGANVVVLQLPAATLNVLAETTRLDAATLSEAVRRSRPMLAGESGAELAVRVHPVERAGTLYVIPELEPTGAFTGSVSEPRKEVALRIFNNDTRTSQSVTATVTRLRGSVALRRSLSAVPPQKIASLTFEIPMGGAVPGQLETVSVQVVHGNAAVRFRTALLAEPPPTAGTVAYLSLPAATETQAYLPAYRANALLAASVDEFGFNLGPGYLWRAGWVQFPEVREPIARAVLQNRVAALTGYALPDARLTNTTLHIRNAMLGYFMSNSFFADWTPAYVAWDQPALPWRFADLYSAAGGRGVIDNFPYPGREPLGMLAGPGGASLPTRHKRARVDVLSKPELRDAARLQRTETAEAGLRTDVLVGEFDGMPDPFWAGDDVSLARSVPRVEVTGAAGRILFESIPSAEVGGYVPPVAEAPAWLSLRPGELIAQPSIKAAFTETQRMLEQAETFATLAAITSAPFPDETLDAAWRELLWASESNRLGFAPDFATFTETLSAVRRAAWYAQDVRNEALDVLARYGDTYTAAPTRSEDVQALMIFNAASFPRSDLVYADIELDQLAGFRLIDDAGRDVQYVAEEVFVRNQRISRIRFSFVARNVPAFGFKTLYIAPQSRPVVWGDSTGNTIENDWYELTVDPALGGKITSLKWKETEDEFAATGLNDVVARTESSLNTDNGRELWSDGGIARASAVEATVRKRVGPGAQRLEISLPFAGGTLTRTLTLFDGLNRVFCTVRLDDARAESGMIGVEFPAPEPNPQAVVGDGLGIRVARVSDGDAPLQTQQTNHYGRAFEPAHGMFYVGPGDAIRGGQNTGYPLRPARIVLADDAFGDAADELVRAFASIGVPADLFDIRQRDRGVYTDARPWTDVGEAQRMGEVLWIVLGDPQAAALGLPAADPGALRFFTNGIGPLAGPVLGVYGGDAETIEAAASSIADAITSTGNLAVESGAIADAVELPNAGLAVYTRGAALVTFDRDSATWLLTHGADSPEWNDESRSLEVDYAIAPIAGDWRSRDVPRRAAEFTNPLVARVTNLHLGEQPSEYSFLTISGEGILASGLRPASMNAAAASVAETHPRNGILFNLAEVHGRQRDAAIRAGGLGFDAGIVNASGTVTNGLRVQKGAFNVDLPPNGFELVGYRPSILKNIPTATPYTGAVTRLEWSRPWEHGRPVLPKGGLPVTLEFREPPPTEKSSVVFVIANNRSDAPVTGTVRIEASDGWAAGATEIAYDLEPRTWQQETVVLLRGHRPDNGYLVAATTVGDTEVVDIWPRNARFNAVAERRADELQIKIENTSPVPLVGSIELICESTQWPELGATPGITPREYTLRINPYETRRSLFTLPNADWQGPLKAKVALNGQLRYVPIPKEN